jgi:type IV pilus assembly protein PilN
MIKINLLKTSSTLSSKKKQTADDFAAEFAFNESSESIKPSGSPVIKILMLLIGPAALFIYEQQHLPVLQAQLNDKQHYLSELKAYNSKQEGAVKEIDMFKKNKEKLQSQIRSIEALSMNRLLFVKSLETLQVGIPEKAWLTKITDITKFKDERTSLNEPNKTTQLPNYKLQVEGIAVSEAEISSFIDSLTRNIHFLDVSLILADEANEKHIIYGDKGKPQSISVKKFKIECTLDPNRDNKQISE